MDIGERIELSDAERAALRFGPVLPTRFWPLEKLLEVEYNVRERIIDKDGVLTEMRQQRTLGAQPARAFQLRSELAVLREAHAQIFAYAMAHSIDLPE
jgi:hypothetical protein